MLKKRPAADRGHARWGWLDTYHSFSFGRYYDPAWMGFRTLRVLNDDRVAPEGGFDTHPHDNMEIITCVLAGELRHRDSMGHESILHAGDVQKMSAGTGIQHSEHNPSSDQELHLLQIWILPEKQGLTPNYQEIHVAPEQKRNRLHQVGARRPQKGAVTIYQDAALYASLLDAGENLTHELAADRYAWVHLIDGVLDVNGVELVAGDGLAIGNEDYLRLSAGEQAHFLLFDLG